MLSVINETILICMPFENPLKNNQHNSHQMLSGTACEAALATASTRGLFLLSILGGAITGL